MKLIDLTDDLLDTFKQRIPINYYSLIKTIQRCEDIGVIVVETGSYTHVSEYDYTGRERKVDNVFAIDITEPGYYNTYRYIVWVAFINDTDVYVYDILDCKSDRPFGNDVDYFDFKVVEPKIDGKQFKKFKNIRVRRHW